MIRAVIDTNVFISGLFWSGKPKEVLKLAFAKKIQGVTSSAILSELEGKLTKKFKYPQEETDNFIRLILSHFQMVEPKISFVVEADKSDNKIVEAAIEAHAEFIITGDKHLLKLQNTHGIKIVTPKEFLEYYAKAATSQ